MPEPYTITAYQDLEVPVSGDTIRLKAGETRLFADACSFIEFVDAAIAAYSTADQQAGSDDHTAEGYDAIREKCSNQGGNPGQGVSPGEPAANPDPSTTDSSTPEGHENENAENLNAPSPPTIVGTQSEPRAPGTSDGRPIAQQYYSSVNPMPIYDVNDQLSSQGVPPDGMDDAINRVIHNDPDPGQPHYHFGRDDRRDPSATISDPVVLFSGQYSLTATDLLIPSRGFSLHLTRVYCSGPVYFGPWGYNWDHNYNVYLRPLNDSGVAIWTGALNEDVFQTDPADNVSFLSPPGVFRKLDHQDPTPMHPERYTLSDREGMQQIFERPQGWSRSDRIPLVRIEDRHGNAHRLIYDAQDRLSRVEDHAGRYILFTYGDCGLLEHVGDHTGRTWHYYHDSDVEHLIAVITPPTPEYREGVTTQYEYDRFREHPALQHNIVRVINPDRRVMVENEYGTDPGSDDFNRIIYQQYGGYEASIHTTRLQYVPRIPDAINVPAIRVEAIDPGVLRVYTFNYRGDLLDERFRLVYDGSYRLVARAYRYDDQGNLDERREPNGLGMLYTYDHDNDDPRARGNLLKLELVAPLSAPQASRIIQILTYEPRFHRLKAIRDEAGKLTTWVYDYEALTGTVGDVVRIEYPAATLPDGTSQPRVERFTYNAFGQLSEQQTAAGHRHTFTYSAAGIANGYLTAITWDADGAAQTQTIEYDAQGHRSAFIDGLGNRAEAVTDALDRTTTIRLPAIAGMVDEVHLKYTPDGRVRREEWPRGSYSDPVITDPFIANEFTYDIFGYRTSAIYGVNSATPLANHYQYTSEGQLLSIVDSLNRETRFTYDERGLILIQTEAAGTPIEAQWHFAYDRNGNRTAVIDPVGHRFDYHYDAWDRLVGLTLPGFPDAERTHIAFTLNRFDRVERTLITGRSSPGGVGTLLDAFTDYDERGRPWRRRLDSRSMISTYDADERVRLQTDQSGHSTTFEWDGLNRIVRATDPLGNVMVHGYDVAGNLTTLENHEQLPGGGVEIIATSIAYDSRLRPTTITAPLNRISRKVYDARGLPIQEIDPLGRVVERTFGLRGEPLSITTQVVTGVTATHHLSYDLVGRQIAYTDPEGRITTYTYDERDRRTSILYPDGRTHRFVYDMHRQIAFEETPGGTVKTFAYGTDAGLAHIDFAPGPNVGATPPLSLQCDGLRRVVYMEQGGLRLTRTFDASLRLRSEMLKNYTASIDYDDSTGTARFTYPDGRVDRMAFDALGRPSSVTLENTGSAALTGILAPGTQLASYEYRGPERVARRTLHTGLVTEFDYDDARRLTAIRHLDPTGASLLTLRYVYDAVNRCRVVWTAPAPAAPARFDYDGLSRVRVAALGLPLAEPPSNPDQTAINAIIAAAEAQVGTTEEEYTLNLSDARTQATRQSVAGTTTDTCILSPTYEISRIDRGGQGAGTFPFTYDDDGRCTQDERYRYRYDAMGHLMEVQELTSLNTILTQTYDPAGRVARRTEGATTYEQTYLGLRLLQRQTSASQPLLQLTPGLGVDEVLMESTGVNRYPLQDAASSLHCYVDATSTVLERYRYSPFGEPTIWAPDGITTRPTTSIDGLLRFGGHPLLNGGLYDARARIYEPRTGRFLQPDPMGYLDSANLYTYTHHDPVGFVDPTGEAAILIGLLVAAGVGLVVGGGLNVVRQGVQIHEGSRKEFSWGELGLSAGVGAIAGPLLVVAPELAIPLTAYGVAGGIGEYSQGHWETGTFDIVTSLAPFGLKGVRAATFGKGTVFAPARGLGPSATAAERFARIPELGRSTQELVGQIWNERLYRGTSYYEALEASEQGTLDIANVRNRQVVAQSPPRLGPGLYFTHEPGQPNIPGSAAYWADFHTGTGGRGGGPAILEASLPRWLLYLIRRKPGVEFNVAQPRAHPSAREAFFPFEGPNNLPPSGPGAEFNAAARYRVWDPNSPQPDLSSLWPTPLIRPLSWPQEPTLNNGTK